MHCFLWFRSVFRVRGPWPKRYGYHLSIIIESVDSINRDERGFPLAQYITNGGISRARNSITHFKHHHRVLRRISNRMSVCAVYMCAAQSKKSPFGVLLLLQWT